MYALSIQTLDIVKPGHVERVAKSIHSKPVQTNKSEDTRNACSSEKMDKYFSKKHVKSWKDV